MGCRDLQRPRFISVSWKEFEGRKLYEIVAKWFHAISREPYAIKYNLSTRQRTTSSMPSSATIYRKEQNIYYALATSIAGPENHRKRVALYQKASEMKKELINNVNEIWQSIPISFIRSLMLRTIEAVDKGLSY